LEKAASENKDEEELIELRGKKRDLKEIIKKEGKARRFFKQRKPINPDHVN
jgi:hypothetical protein